MIKIQIVNPLKDRNKNSFTIFHQCKDLFSDIGIEFVNNTDYDFLFLGMSDFMDKKIPLQESIKWGCDNINSLPGDKFIFDGSDSTSLLGSIEVLRNTNAKYLFKNQILSRESYRNPSVCCKWFFGSDPDRNISYDITENEYERIKLSGYNLGYHNDYPTWCQPIRPEKSIDLCAIFSSDHARNSEHLLRNDDVYNNHRIACLKATSKIQNKVGGKFDFRTYMNYVAESKFSLSPFGQGEVCFRDFEIMAFGSCLVKPDMSRVITTPNVYNKDTYIPCLLDFSDLTEQLALSKDSYKEKTENLREQYLKKYTMENFVLHWYDIFKNIDGITT